MGAYIAICFPPDTLKHVQTNWYHVVTAANVGLINSKVFIIIIIIIERKERCSKLGLLKHHLSQLFTVYDFWSSAEGKLNI